MKGKPQLLAGLSPISHLELSQTRLSESSIIIETPSGQYKSDKQKSLRQKHRTKPHGSAGRPSSLGDLLCKLYLKRVRFSFQLAKQYFLFSESDVSLQPGYRYMRDAVEEGYITLECFFSSQAQRAKVMGFERIRFLLANRITLAELRALRIRHFEERLSCFTAIIAGIFQKLQKKALAEFYEAVQEFAELHRSKILTPYPELHTTRKTSRSALSAKHSEALSDRQFIYIVNTSSSRRVGPAHNEGRGLRKRKSGFIKVPLVADNVVINEVSLEGIRQHPPHQ